MEKIILNQKAKPSVTILPNEFIDQYMAKADGEYVKIYLLILRASQEGGDIHPDEIADQLDLTMKDVSRALKYWEKEGLLSGEKKEEKKEEVPQAPPVNSPVPLKPSRNPMDITSIIEKKDLSLSQFMTESYLGRPLTTTELNSMLYILEDLHFSSELYDYLVEYCVSRDKKSFRYIEKVAINWFEENIDTVKKAQAQSSQYNQGVFSVMKAFGLGNRNPGEKEMEYIKQWYDMGFREEIIIEACNRTLIGTNQASFPYANKILLEWFKEGVSTMEDIKKADQKHYMENPPVKNADQPQQAPAVATPKPNAFHNFEQRSYDYSDLQSKLLDKNRRP